MSSSLDPRDVLAYLNELGYTNITAQQLKDFVKGMYVTIFFVTEFFNRVF